jgi:hypothetical protein
MMPIIHPAIKLLLDRTPAEPLPSLAGTNSSVLRVQKYLDANPGLNESIGAELDRLWGDAGGNRRNYFDSTRQIRIRVDNAAMLTFRTSEAASVATATAAVLADYLSTVEGQVRIRLKKY